MGRSPRCVWYISALSQSPVDANDLFSGGCVRAPSCDMLRLECVYNYPLVIRRFNLIYTPGM